MTCVLTLLLHLKFMYENDKRNKYHFLSLIGLKFVFDTVGGLCTGGA